MSGRCFIQAAAVSLWRGGEQVYNGVCFQIDQDCAEALPTQQREVINAQIEDRLLWQISQRHDPTQKRLARALHT